jgi:hypothetical protein
MSFFLVQSCACIGDEAAFLAFFFTELTKWRLGLGVGGSRPCNITPSVSIDQQTSSGQQDG